MKKLFVIFISFFCLLAHADPRYGYRHHDEWVAPFVFGAIVGSIARPAPQPYYPPPQQYCSQEPVYTQYGEFAGYRTICR